MCGAQAIVRFVPIADIGSVCDQLAFCLVQAAFESDVFARRCTVKRGRAGHDCENEHGRKSKANQEQARRPFYFGGFSHPGRLAAVDEG
jgi:hypothetical protein